MGQGNTRLPRYPQDKGENPAEPRLGGCWTVLHIYMGGFGAMNITLLSCFAFAWWAFPASPGLPINALPLPEAEVLQKQGCVKYQAAGGHPLGRPSLPCHLIIASFPTHCLRTASQEAIRLQERDLGFMVMIMSPFFFFLSLSFFPKHRI